MKSLLRAILLPISAALLLAFQFVSPVDPLPEAFSLGGPDRELSWSEAQLWLRGRLMFDRDFSLSQGVGRPHYNGDSCRACHSDPVIGGSSDVDLNVSRVASSEGGGGFATVLTNDPSGNPQILSRLTRPDAGLREEHPVAGADLYEQRNAPSALGLGLIGRLPAGAILALQDPDDLNADGIRGVARIVNTGNGTALGRFGWKAQVPTLSDFVRDAMGEEIGITVEAATSPFGITSDADGIADPELSPTDFESVTFFLEHLAAPKRAGSTGPMVAEGEQIFTQIGCNRCHTPVLYGPDGPVPLFSNLLLHQVSSSKFRGMEEPGAPAGFYRTPPLWGLRHSKPYMHDGSAETPLSAIRAHEGEAQLVRDAFEALTPAAQTALLAFLDDL